MVDATDVGALRRTDVIVVGSGAAGLATALHAGGARVALLTADTVGADSASARAQGGIAAAVGPPDSPAAHAADTLAVGAHANDPSVVDLLTAAAPSTVAWLAALGTRFARDDAGWVLGREAGHRHDRILHAGGDATGREVTRALCAAVAAAPHVTVWERTRVVALLADGSRVVGVLARRATAAAGDGSHRMRRGRSPEGGGSGLIAIGAGAVVLATGGCAGAWRATTNPPSSRGAGLVLAADAGAELIDLEYVQFHPTALDVPTADPLPLLTEALRGAGARLVDGDGRRVLAGLHPAAELAPRDVVARAVWQRHGDGTSVFLDMRPVDDLARRFPTAVAACWRHGLDPTATPVPITPAAHYHMGGIAVDRNGRSSVAGLHAAGEVACTGAHGANRLASNSLLEALVFGERVGRAVRTARPVSDQTVARAVERVDRRLLATPDDDAIDRARDLLTAHVGVLRTERGLRRALDELRTLADPDAGGQIAAVARMIAAAALAHRERRGAHWRTDSDAALPTAPRVVVTAANRTDPVVSVQPRTPAAADTHAALAGV
ncbi:MAG: L-aspartate oxidase [Actinobacteria bacterium]|nr:L-aspartate oxidase [Actinomycetota bacterium]